MRVVVIGGGAAGMIAAISARKAGDEVILLEKNASLGNKLKITGKGRCNVTFNGDFEYFKNNMVKNSKFMHSCFSKFSNYQLIQYLTSIGVKTKLERGNRFFLESDNANELVVALEKELKKLGVTVVYNACLQDIIVKQDAVVAVIASQKEYSVEKCILATGGMTYPGTGSTGDGYKIAKKIGHTVIELMPALVGLKSNNAACKELQGLTLKNINYKIMDDTRTVYTDFGELLFSHFGITGPTVLSSSSVINRVVDVKRKMKEGKITAIVDLKPALTKDVLDKRIQRDFETNMNRDFKNALGDLFPHKLIPYMIKLSGIDENKKVNQITKLERESLVNNIKNFKIVISDLMPMETGIVTAGGIDLKEVNPKDLQSRKVKGLHFAGEVLDIDAYTGGFNLQIAFSTGYLCGLHIM